MSLLTELHTQTPPPEKYAPHLSIATSTEEQGIADAVLAGKEARTLATEPEVETSEDGKITATSVESPISERQTALERLAKAEAEAEQDWRDWTPLTESDAEAKQALLKQANLDRYNAQLQEAKARHDDWDAVFADAPSTPYSDAKRDMLVESGPETAYFLAKNPELLEKFAVMSDAEAANFLKENRTQLEPVGQAAEPERAKATEGKSDYDRALEQVAAQGENVEQFVEKLQEPIFPASEEGYAKFQVLSYALNQVSNRRDVVLALAKDSQALAKIATADTPDVLAAEVHKLSARLKFPQAAQTSSAQPARSRLRPTVPVGGSVKSTVPPDEMPYSEYRKWREKTKRRY